MAVKKPERDPATPPDFRLTSLEERLKRAEEAEAKRHPDVGAERVRATGRLVAQNLIGAPLGGFLIGFVFDRIFDTAPWIALTLMFVSFAGAVWNLLKRHGPGRGQG